MAKFLPERGVIEMKGARMIVECLKREGVDTVFSYPGGSVIPLLDAMDKYGREIRLIQPRHEQAGTHAADGYARVTGKPGVVIVTSGPGATNTLTGIATAYMDSVPLVVIAGQVPVKNLGRDAFQEVDMVGMCLPVTKEVFLVRRAREIPLIFKNAFYICKTGRPGPVVIEIPVDVQKEKAKFFYPENVSEDVKQAFLPTVNEDEIKKKVEKIVSWIKDSKKPVVISGGGVIFSDSAEEMNTFLDKYEIPFVTTLMGCGVYPKKDYLFLGGAGMHGTVYANKTLQEADLIIGFGTRFSDRLTGNPSFFAPHAKIIHVDIDHSEIGKNVRTHLSINAPVKKVLKFLNKYNLKLNFSKWLEQINQWKKVYLSPLFENRKLMVHKIITKISEYFLDDTIISVDVGQNQMWVYQFYPFKKPRCFLSSSGLGTMGYALPAGIGAKIGLPNREVLVIAGDGGFQMNIQELATCQRYCKGLKMIVLDNKFLGMVRQWQELFFKKRYVQTNMEDNPDFCEIAKAYGIKTNRITSPDEIDNAIKELYHSKDNFLLHALIEREENVLPMVIPDGSIDKMITNLRKVNYERKKLHV